MIACYFFGLILTLWASGRISRSGKLGMRLALMVYLKAFRFKYRYSGSFCKVYAGWFQHYIYRYYSYIRISKIDILVNGALGFC